MWEEISTDDMLNCLCNTNDPVTLMRNDCVQKCTYLIDYDIIIIVQCMMYYFYTNNYVAIYKNEDG